MIIDNFKNCEKYYSINKYFKKAFEYIKANDLKVFKDGRYEIDGNNVYINVSEYTTKTISKPEYHKNYIDIQFLVKGTEYIGYCPIEQLIYDDEFDEKNDVGFGLGVVDYIKIRPNQFMILFPNDAHQPCMADGTPKDVKKVVVKVRVD